jgi:enoyl-CoA hydratase/carnithine racemase
MTVAAIHGHCVGGGVVLASACDMRIAAHSTRFAIPEVDLGIPLTWGAIPRLVRELGPAMTRDLVISCRPFSSVEAFEMGFISRLLDDDDFFDQADALVQALAAKAPMCVRATLDAVAASADAMVPTGHCWADADAFVTAQHDPESRAAAAQYLASLGRR